jgi:hypothetical protein
MQLTTNGSRARTEGEQSPIAAESTLPPGTVVLQAAAGRAAATPATTAPQQQFQQRTQQPDQQQQPQQQQPQKQRQSLSKHDIVNRIKPLLKQYLAEGQLHRDTYKQASTWWTSGSCVSSFWQHYSSTLRLGSSGSFQLTVFTVHCASFCHESYTVAEGAQFGSSGLAAHPDAWLLLHAAYRPLLVYLLQANKAAVGLLFQLQRPFTAAEAEQAVQQAVHEVLQGQGSPN